MKIGNLSPNLKNVQIYVEECGLCMELQSDWNKSSAFVGDFVFVRGWRGGNVHFNEIFLVGF